MKQQENNSLLTSIECNVVPHNYMTKKMSIQPMIIDSTQPHKIVEAL